MSSVRGDAFGWQQHPDPAISQENHVGVFGADGRDEEWLRRFAGIRRVSDHPDKELVVDVLAVGLPYGKRSQRVGVRVSVTLSDETDVEVVVHRRSVDSTIEREVRRDIREPERVRLLADIAQSADPQCERCRGTGALVSGRVPCRYCTGVTFEEFSRPLGSSR